MYKKLTSILCQTPQTHSQLHETPSEISETVYSEPIQPSLFADAVGTDDSEDFQPYGLIHHPHQLAKV